MRRGGIAVGEGGNATLVVPDGAEAEAIEANHLDDRVRERAARTGDPSKDTVSP